MKSLIIGAGISGIACAKLLAKNDYEVYLTDLNEIKNKEELTKLGIKIYDLGHPDILKDNVYDLIVKNPGIKYSSPFVKYFVDQGYFLYNEIEIASSFVTNYHYGAITGTNGKTTTTTLLKEFLKCKNIKNDAVGNIGKALSEVVLNNGDIELDLAIEVAAFQLLGFDKFRPDVAACINLTPDHLDYFDNISKYYEAKMLIYKNQHPDDWFLLNLDDENIINYAKNIPSKVVTFSLSKQADLMIDNGYVTLFNKVLFEVKDLKLPGLHNLQNAMVASAMAYKMGVSIEDIKRVISNFKGVKHRLEFVREIDGIRYYNDSKGTNPESTIVALKAFDDNVILLAGGYDKHTGFDSIKPYLSHVKSMIVFGDTKYQLKELYKDAVLVDDMETAIKYAHKIAEKGDVVLLSPMCASWDQFKNFEERGDIFVSIVEGL